MIHVNEKCFTSDGPLWKDHFWLKKKKTRKNQLVKIRQLEKIFEYFKIQESLPSENVTEYKEYFLYIFSYPKRYYTSTN